MAISKDEVKTFIKLCLVEFQKRSDSKYAELAHYNVLKQAVEEVSGNLLDPNDFVTKQDGKGLSSEDYTTAEKALLAQLAAYNNVAGFTSTDVQEVLDF